MCSILLEFSVSNYRSIKEKQTLSLIASNSQAKPDNVFDIELSHGDKMTFLRSAVIYGANASGKSNLIKAFDTFLQFIRISTSKQIGESIEFYDPFLFEKENEPLPTIFVLSFLGKDRIKYQYSISFLKNEILEEILDYYPKGQKANLFSRNNTQQSTEFSHTVTLSRNVSNQKINKEVFKNQLYLSQFGNLIVHEQLTPVFSFIKEFDTWNSSFDVKKAGAWSFFNQSYVEYMQWQIMEEFSESGNEALLKRLKKLIRISDTKIEDVRIKKEEIPVHGNLGVKTTRFSLYGKHDIYENETKTGEMELPFREESAGSNILFALGGFILKKLDKGGVFIIDEIDSSLHPKLTKFLVKLFNNPVSNPKNAQLICATHEVTLLDKDMFRTDQVWFTEKNKFGATELFAIKDFDGVREGIPFDKWYQNGKFGGEPKIKEIEFIFGDNE